MLAGWHRDGKETFCVDDLTQLSGHIGKGRTWFYTTLPKFTGFGWLEIAEDGTGAKQRWRILPAITGQLHAVDDQADDDQDGAA